MAFWIPKAKLRRFGDLNPEPFAHYALHSRYSGNQTVSGSRRSSDNAEDDFSSGQIGLPIEAWAGGGGDAMVTDWYDLTGNGRHAVQSVSTQQPKIVDSGSLVAFANRPYVDFDGVDNCLSLPSSVYQAFGSADDFSIEVVFYYSGTTPSATNILVGCIADDATNRPQYNLNINSAGYLKAVVRQSADNTENEVESASALGAGIHTAKLAYTGSSSQVELTLDGVSQGTDSANSLTFAAGDFDEGNIGALGATGAAFDGFFDGGILEVIIRDTV